jgi:predicted HTH transcriptional regulator
MVGLVSCSACGEPATANITQLCDLCKTNGKRRREKTAERVAKVPQAPAKRTDPKTSHAAAAVGGTSRLSDRQKCLMQLQTTPGMTAGEIGDVTGLGHPPAQKRLSELKSAGLIYAKGTRIWPQSGRRQDVLFATPPLELMRDE